MKNLRRIFLIIVLIVPFTQNAFAQANFQYNFYNQNQLVFNPASPSQGEYANVFVNYRQQWAGFEGAPRTAMVGGQTRYGSSGGIGLVFINNRWGAIDDNMIQLSNAYSFKITKKDQLHLGISVGLTDRQININRINVENFSEDDLLNNRLADLTDDWSFNSGFGVSYIRDNFTLSLSSPELYNARSNNLLQSQMTYLSYRFEVAQGAIEIMPSTLIRVIKNNPTQYDLNVKAEWNDIIWLQPTYRSSKNVIISSGVNHENVSLGYSFELTSATQHIANNSHEIVMSINFNRNKKSKLHKVE